MKKENPAEALERMIRAEYEDYTLNTEATEAAKEAAQCAEDRARAALAWIRRVDRSQRFYVVLFIIMAAVVTAAIWVTGHKIIELMDRVKALEGKCAIEQPEQPEQPECKCK